MGYIIESRCICDKEFDDLVLHSGYNTYQVPTPCYNCGILFKTNLLEQFPKCPKCGKPVEYFGEWVDDFNPNRMIIFEWETLGNEDYILEDKKYKCPNCLQEELIFFFVGDSD